ncbi:MAG: T9SS type A sorting domain-containing protein [Bacteroidales bacterium]|nr:T9SS type A sorting domain-containing protein [Bacteroidales bacterium]
MRKLILFSAALFGSALMMAQSLSITTHENQAIANGQKIYAGGLPSNEIVVELKVKNTSANSLMVKAKKTEISVVSESTNVFCWTLCYSPSTYVSPDSVVIEAGNSYDEFSGHYNTGINLGHTVIMYTFFDIMNPSDSVSVLIEYSPSWISLSAAKGDVMAGSLLKKQGPPTQEMFEEIEMTNNDAMDKNIMVKKVHGIQTAGTANYFCWGACFDPSIFVSDPVYLYTGQSSNEFSVHYMPNNNLGTSEVKYVIWDADNRADSIWFTMQFDATDVGIEHPATTSKLSAYPNPASNQVNISYQLPVSAKTATLRIVNLTGQEVYNTRLNGNKGIQNINISILSPGMYIYALYADGKPITSQKLTINR